MRPKRPADEAREAQEKVEHEEKGRAARKGVDPVQGAAGSDHDLIKINCFIPIRINEVLYEGIVEVPRHIAQTLVPMLQAKLKSDISIFVGKNHLIERLAGNNALKITEVK